jgi:hypothetical protein
VAAATPVDPWFDRPVFIVSTPRSGSTLLFETLCKLPGVYSIGGESHHLFETLPALHPRSRGYASNRLEVADATQAIGEEIRRRFRGSLKDALGRPAPAGRVRMLEKTPKNALRIPFLRTLFPEARFLYLHRDPRQVMGSMIDAWHSGRFRTYPELPGWQGPPWSLLLVPGWQALSGRPLPEVVAAQWEVTTRILLDDLAEVPAERVTCIDYAAFLEDSAGSLQRIGAALGLEGDAADDKELPLSRYTLTRPEPDKWRRHAEFIEPLLQRHAATVERAARFAGLD